MTGLTQFKSKHILDVEVTKMPRDTFMNLDKKKQNKIFKAAINEFSQHRFTEASINKIIKEAEIARGSFYQYFSDKEDLFDYMMQKIRREKAEEIQNQKIDSNVNFFEMYLQTALTAIQWAQKHPKYNRIGVLITRDDSKEMNKYNALSEIGYKHFIQYIDRDKERGLVSKNIDGKLLVDMLSSISRDMLLKIYLKENIEEITVISELESMFEIVKKGVS